MVDGNNLKLIAEVHSRTEVIWAENIATNIKNRYLVLTAKKICRSERVSPNSRRYDKSHSQEEIQYHSRLYVSGHICNKLYIYIENTRINFPIQKIILLSKLFLLN